MKTFLERYLAGEHEQVWDELLAYGPAIRMDLGDYLTQNFQPF